MAVGVVGGDGEADAAGALGHGGRTDGDAQDAGLAQLGTGRKGVAGVDPGRRETIYVVR